MALTEAYSGSASISTTEYSLPNASTTLTPITADGVYQPWIDFSALAAGDAYEVKLYEKCRSASSQKSTLKWYIEGGQTDPLWFPQTTWLLLHGWDLTVKKITGTDRTIEWSIRQVA